MHSGSLIKSDLIYIIPLFLISCIFFFFNLKTETKKLTHYHSTKCFTAAVTRQTTSTPLTIACTSTPRSLHYSHLPTFRPNPTDEQPAGLNEPTYHSFPGRQLHHTTNSSNHNAHSLSSTQQPALPQNHQPPPFPPYLCLKLAGLDVVILHAIEPTIRSDPHRQLIPHQSFPLISTPVLPFRLLIHIHIRIRIPHRIQQPCTKPHLDYRRLPLVRLSLPLLLLLLQLPKERIASVLILAIHIALPDQEGEGAQEAVGHGDSVRATWGRMALRGLDGYDQGAVEMNCGRRKDE